ncbi:MAG: response regulator [Sandaracinus sp.]
MSSDSSRPTPLGVARARFVEGLARKAQELKGSVALLAGTPNEEKPREELRRRLHALYASAQVFQLERLASALKEAIAKLDLARDERRGLADAELDLLALLAATLPVLGAEAPAVDAEAVALPRPAAVPSSMQGRTLKGVPAVAPPPPPPPPRVSLPAAPPPPPIVPPPSPDLKEELASSIERRVAPPPSTGAALRGAPVVSVLVCDAAETQARVRALLASERFEVLGASDPEEALRLARSSAPDVVLVDRGIVTRAGSDFVRRLREDPLTDFVPIVALVPAGEEIDAIAVRDLGCEDVLPRPLEGDALERAIVRLAAIDGTSGSSAFSGDLTVAELAGKIAEEIRRGLVESLDRGRDLSVPIGDGTEVLAATWSAIGRLRAHLASRSGGRLHFREREGAAATLALVDDEGALDASDEVSLRDRRVLIADDDPAVVWFFSNLLKEAGAIPTETHDGEEALLAARRSRPDVLIADILMPRLDGFSLTRELKRDPVLSDVPVVLLSWKEDFLQRMRELSAGASGYLRKEAGASQILAAVREVLRPRARLEQRLRAGGDVRGRLERIGVLPLLYTTAQHRPDARITVRDAWNLFEIDLRKKPGEASGALVDVTRTASDGSFSRGPRVLGALLGAVEGRFTVVDSDVPVRASVREPLDVVLTRAANELGALVDAVSGRGLLLAHRVTFDEDVLGSILRAAPPTVAAVVDALRRGRGPRALVVDGTFAPQDVERVLVDLARQGAILGVFGDGDEDRVAAARRERGDTAIPVRAPSLLPPRHEPSALESLTPSEAGLDLSWAKNEEETANIVRETLRKAGEGPSAPPPSEPDDDGPVLQFGTAPDEGDEGDDTLDETAEAKAAPRTITVPAKRPIPELPPEAPPSDETPLDAADGEEPKEAEQADAPASEPTATATASEDAKADAEPGPASDDADADEPDESEPPPPKPTPEPSARPAPKPTPKAQDKPAPKAEEPSAGLSAFQWTFLLAALALLGFGAWRLTHPSQAPATTIITHTTANEDAAVVAAPSDVDAGAEIAAETPPSTAAFTSYGRDEASIPADLGLTVGASQGVLVIEPGPEPIQVRIGTDLVRRVDRAPVAIALPADLYEIAFLRGDGTSFRFARVIAGHTRYVPVPTL